MFLSVLFCFLYSSFLLLFCILLYFSYFPYFLCFFVLFCRERGADKLPEAAQKRRLNISWATYHLAIWGNNEAFSKFFFSNVLSWFFFGCSGNISGSINIEYYSLPRVSYIQESLANGVCAWGQHGGINAGVMLLAPDTEFSGILGGRGAPHTVP